MKNTINKYYVYYLIDPKDNQPFYVGKGYNNRIYLHEKRVRRGIIPNKNLYLYNSIKEILDGGKNIIYKKIKTDLTEYEALRSESLEIKKYGRKSNNTGILCNMTDGGEGISGFSHNKNTKITLSNFFKRKPTWSSLHKKEMSQKFSREKNPFYGKTHNKETIEKISKVLKEKWKKEDHPLKGKLKSKNHKESIRISMTGHAVSEKTKYKMSLSQKERFGDVSGDIKDIIISLYNGGCGCKSILKELKQNYNFTNSIFKIKRILKDNGFNLNLRNKQPIKIKIVSDAGKINIFNSIGEAEKFIGCGKSNINKILKRNGKYKQFIIEKLTY